MMQLQEFQIIILHELKYGKLWKYWHPAWNHAGLTNEINNKILLHYQIDWCRSPNRTIIEYTYIFLIFCGFAVIFTHTYMKMKFSWEGCLWVVSPVVWVNHSESVGSEQINPSSAFAQERCYSWKLYGVINCKPRVLWTSGIFILVELMSTCTHDFTWYKRASLSLIM